MIFDKDSLAGYILGCEFLLEHIVLWLGVGVGIAAELSMLKTTADSRPNSHSVDSPEIVLLEDEEVAAGDAKGNPEKQIAIVGHDEKHHKVGDESVEEEKSEHHEPGSAAKPAAILPGEALDP